MTLEEKIDRIEASLPKGRVPGTAIQRVLVDKSLLKEFEVTEDPKDRESAILWCVTYGDLMQPWKRFFYGRTIEEATDKTLAFIEKQMVRKETC